MATRPFTADDSVNSPSPEGAQAPQALGSVGRHQLNVMAADIADVVRLTGGWLCDQARAGWAVNVLVAGCHDVRPLAILGARPLDGDTESMLASASLGGALAVSAELLRTDAHLCDHVLKLSKRGAIEVTVWGDGWPAELGRQVEPVQHRLSVAARAFKGRALVAAAASADSVGPTETLFHLGSQSVRPLYSV